MSLVRRMSAREWAPSRMASALFGLIGLGVLSTVNPDHLRHDPDRVESLELQPAQNAAEAFILAIGYFSILTAYLIYLASHLLHFGSGGALLMAIPIAFLSMFVVHLLAFAVSGVHALFRRIGIGRGVERLRVESIAQNTLFVVLAIAFLPQGGWIRWLAIAWLVLVAMNICAAVVLRSIPRTVYRLERRAGLRE